MSEWFEYWVPWVPAIALAIATIFTGIITIYNRRGGEKAKELPTYEEYAAENRALRADLDDARRKLDKLWHDFYEFKELAAARDRALTNILHAVASQWPADYPGPVFESIDIEIVADTIPAIWRNRRKDAS